MTLSPDRRDPRLERVLVTGATGFIGSRLADELPGQNFEVVCASRHPEEAAEEDPQREWVFLDAQDEQSIVEAMSQCHGAYYLIHAMGEQEQGDFEEREAQAALNFARAAERAALKRVVYLGGVLPDGEEPSKHLRSRMKTGQILRQGEVPCVELRASMVIGEGSASWRIIRDLCARLPVMLLPHWAKSRTEPIALDDALFALIEAMRMPIQSSLTLGIPGPEALSLKEIILRTSALLGAEPPTFDVPLLSPALSKGWLNIVTRADSRIAAELIEGLKHDLLAQGETIWERAPDHELMGFDQAASRALQGEARDLNPIILALEDFVRGAASA